MEVGRAGVPNEAGDYLHCLVCRSCLTLIPFDVTTDTCGFNRVCVAETAVNCMNGVRFPGVTLLWESVETDRITHPISE